MNDLWAKSPTRDGRPQLSLQLHTEQVMETAAQLFGKAGAATHLGDQWLRFFKLDKAGFDLFAQTLQAAAAFHDIGKANDGFHDALDRKGDQAIRHEHFSALLMHDPLCWKWLKQHEGVDWEVALSAVLTHHLQAPMDEPIPSLSTSRKHVRLLVGNALNKLTATIQRRLGLKGEWPKVPYIWSFDRALAGAVNVQTRRASLADTFYEMDDYCGDRKRLLRAVRASLITADAAASGLYREDKDMAAWLADRFENMQTCDASYIRKEIIQKRIDQLGKRWNGWHKFQDATAVQPSRTLLLAPCGSGKTLAAWRWIEEQTRRQPVKRIIFLYPTRATATEGFKDYVAWAPEADAALIHGTAGYELEGMFANPADKPDARKSHNYSVDPRLFSIAFWSKRIFAGTVDQFLAFLQYSYGPMCLLPVLADSVVVIDEVHSFDEQMFSALKAFLKEFDLPVLCMTATLPKIRREELKKCGLIEYDEKPDDLKDIADAPRYAIRPLNTRDEAASVVEKALADKKRVLWVVNTVRAAQELATKFGTVETPAGLQTSNGIRVLCYHSRFTLNDRKHWHECVVSAFKRNEGDLPQPILAITTQVCEMSLDLDADVLITEHAPITALIQRMGRCNRKNEVPKNLGQVYLYKPEKPAPYKPEDLIGVPEFINALIAQPHVSQSFLEEALRNAPRPPVKGDRLTQFIVSGPYSDGDEEDFRDIDDFARRGILDEAEYLRTSRVQRPGLIVPVPWKLHERFGTDRETRYLMIAKSGLYHKALGLCDEIGGG